MTDPVQQVKVLLADDSGVMLRAVARLLEGASQVALVGAARDFEEAIRLAEEHQPHVLVLDLRMAQKAHADALRFKAQQLGLRLLAITAANVNDQESIAMAAAIGADKLLDKMELDEKLVPTILALANAVN
jgi:chemotaxis response regulator CheB